MQQQDIDCDVLVIGSGAAGLATAVTASHLGLDALVCEHADRFGGTSAISGGEVWIPMNRHSGGTAADSAPAALTYLEHVVGPYLDRARAEAYVSRAAEALAFFEDHSHVEYELLPGVVDYFTDLPGATCGLRSLGAMPFDGRRLGRRFAEVRSPLPVSMIFGGMALGREDLPHFTRFTRSARSAAHVVGMLLRHGRDRLAGHTRGTRMVMGNALVGRLALTLFERKVPLWLNTTTLELTRESGRITGARVRQGNDVRRIRARRGVVVACGGFSGSATMQARFYPHVQAGKAHYSHLPTTNDGSAFGLVTACGGVIDEHLAQPGAWTPVSVVRLRDGSQGLAPHFGDRAKPGVLVVNWQGRRFANEALNYHDFMQAMLHTNAGRHSAECYVLTSHRHLRKYGLGRVPGFPGRIGPFLRSGYLVKGGTPRELADRLGVDAAGLEQTVRDFDEHASHGVDPQFRKGETAYERAAGDPEVKPNPCVAPLGEGPYYAVRIVPGDIGTLVGVKVDATARALDATGRPIPGLYAVGTVAASVMGGTYPGAGAMLGPALTFGYLAAHDIAAGGAATAVTPPGDGVPVAAEPAMRTA
jgi:succinate dehydrogenase/fumarate reductase flavoprotein subunit